MAKNLKMSHPVLILVATVLVLLAVYMAVRSPGDEEYVSGITPGDLSSFGKCRNVMKRLEKRKANRIRIEQNLRRLQQRLEIVNRNIANDDAILKRDCFVLPPIPPLPGPIPTTPPPNPNQYIGKTVIQVEMMLKASHPNFPVRKIKEGQPLTMDYVPNRIDVFYKDLPVPPNVRALPGTFTSVTRVVFPKRDISHLTFAPQY